MARVGILVDKSGDEIKDLAGLTFKKTPLEKSTNVIVSAIDKLCEPFEKMPEFADKAASTGHSSTRMLARYTHPTGERKTGALECPPWAERRQNHGVRLELPTSALRTRRSVTTE